MSKILLDYVFPISVITPTPEASTGFLRQVAVVAKPKAGQEANVGNIYLCTSMTEVAVRTANTNAQQLFNAGMSKVYILLSDDLALEEELVGADFYTVLISDDFDKDDITDSAASGIITVTSYTNLISGTADVISVAGIAFTPQAGVVEEGLATFQAVTSNELTAESLAAQINAHEVASASVTAVAVGAVVTVSANETGVGGNLIPLVYTNNDVGVGVTLTGLASGKLSGGAGTGVGTFDGIVGVSSDDAAWCALQAAIEDRVCFFSNSTNKAKNMFYAFGKMLSNPSNWTNQQYIPMPFNDGVDLGQANSLFDSKVSFVINDDEFGNRLGLFAAGGRAIVAPYILKNLRIDLQSAALTWISGNQPQYTIKEASLLETRLQTDVINQGYIERKWITAGTIDISLFEENFVANGAIDVADPKALWRVFSEMRQTL